MSREPLEHLLGQMAAHRELLAQVYHAVEFTKTADNAKNVELLSQLKVLNPQDEAIYTLNNNLRGFFDSVLNARRLFATGGDYGDKFAQLDRLVDSLIDAAGHGHYAEKAAIESQLRVLIYDIADGLSHELQSLRVMVENRFGEAKNLKQRIAQKNHYLERTQRLIDTLREFSLSKLGDRVFSTGACANIVGLYRKQLQDRLPFLAQDVLDINRVIGRYLHEDRAIEEQTRRVRTFGLFLERNPQHLFYDWDEADQPQAWLMRSKGISINAHPLIWGSSYEDALAEIASDLAPSEARVPVRERAAGKLLADDDEPETRTIQQRPHKVALRQMIESCRTTGNEHSALEWHGLHAQQIGCELTIWLHCVLHDLSKHPQPGIDFSIVEAPYREFDGNILVKDIQISLRA